MFGRWMSVGTLVVGLLALAATGCVSKDELDKAMAASRRAHDELLKCQTALQTINGENQKLRDDLAAERQASLAKDAMIAKLQGANTDLQAKLDDAVRKARELAGRDVTFPAGPALPAAMDAALKKLVDESGEVLGYDPRTGMVRMNADMTFAPGSVTINPKALEALGKLAQILNMAEAKPFRTVIGGHTDDMPIVKPETLKEYKNNWELSAGRSLAVVEALFNSGVNQSRMAGMEFSKYQPLAANAPGNKGNAANRRVEIWIVPPERFLSTGTPLDEAPAK